MSVIEFDVVEYIFYIISNMFSAWYKYALFTGRGSRADKSEDFNC